MPPASRRRSMAFARSATGAAAIFATCRGSSTGWPMKPAPASWRSIRCMPSTIAVRTTPARICPIRSSIRTSCTWIVESHSGFCRTAGAHSGSGEPEVQQEIAALRATEFVEYERVHALKIRFLKLLFAAFLREHRSGSPRAQQFDEYHRARRRACCERFATYSALDEWIHRRNPEIWMWPEWPEPFRDPQSAETQAFRKKHWRLVLFYQYVAVADRRAAGRRTAACPRQRAVDRTLS